MPSSGVQTCADRKSIRLNSSHGSISYAVFCLKKQRHARQGLAGMRPPRVPAPDPSGPRPALGGVSRACPTMGSQRPPEAAREPSIFFNDTATTEIYTLSLHDALPI